MGPPPPPLPPPLKALNQSNHLNAAQLNLIESVSPNSGNGQPESADTDSGLEVIEEPTLKPSEMVRGNHNRTMSTISGMILTCNNFCVN